VTRPSSVLTNTPDMFSTHIAPEHRAQGESHEFEHEFTTRPAASTRTNSHSKPRPPWAQRAPYPRRQRAYPLDHPRPRCPEPSQNGGPAHSIRLFQLLSPRLRLTASRSSCGHHCLTPTRRLPGGRRVGRGGSGRCVWEGRQPDQATQNSLPSGSAITTWCPVNSRSVVAPAASSRATSVMTRDQRCSGVPSPDTRRSR
jgi:hypothetical protein